MTLLKEHSIIFPREALELGYACMTFKGPGQGVVLRRDKLACHATRLGSGGHAGHWLYL